MQPVRHFIQLLERNFYRKAPDCVESFAEASRIRPVQTFEVRLSERVQLDLFDSANPCARVGSLYRLRFSTQLNQATRPDFLWIRIQ